MKYLFTISLIFLLPGFSPAQPAIADVAHIGFEKGLSARIVTDIIKDPIGFIWIATSNGLNRYDGMTITAIDNHPTAEPRISAKYIQKISTSPSGDMIIQYRNNRRFLDVFPRGQSRAIKLFLNQEAGVKGEVETILTDNQEQAVYLLTNAESGLLIQTLSAGLRFESTITIRDYTHDKGSVYTLYTGQENSFWLHDSQNGLVHIDSTGQIIWEEPVDEKKSPEFLFTTRSGRVWASFTGKTGLYQFSRDSNEFLLYPHSQANLFYKNIWDDEHGSLITLTHNRRNISQMWKIDPEKGAQPLNELNTYIEDNITCVYGDNFNKLLFIGTDQGLYKIVLNTSQITNLLSANDNGPTTLAPVGDGDVMAVVDRREWHRINPFFDTITVAHVDCPVTTSIVYDSTNCAIWAGAGCAGGQNQLIRYDVDDTTLTTYHFPHRIRALYADHEGMIWLASIDDEGLGHLTVFDPVANTFHHTLDLLAKSPIGERTPTCLMIDSMKNIWVGTSYGLLYYNPVTALRKWHTTTENNYARLPSNSVTALAPGADGTIWIGTQGGGLSLYSTASDEFVNYSIREGLIHNDVVGLLPEGSTNIWVTTTAGISYYDGQSRTFRNFTTRDGFSSMEFSENAIFRAFDSTIYTGTTEGVSVFNPKHLLGSDLSAPILLTELSYFATGENAIINRRFWIDDSDKIILPASNKYFSCKFILADYAYPTSNQYLYKLEGLDINWNYIGTQNELRFNNLPAGKYELMIRGADRNGNISSAQLALGITVKQVFYRQPWFLVLVLALIGLAVYINYQIKLQQMLKMERLRTKISSDLHDDVGGLLSGLAMQTELLAMKAKNEDVPKLQRISEMSRNAMAQMRDVIWATDARKDRYEDLLLRMKEYAAEILYPNGISCHFHTETLPMDKKMKVSQRQNLYLIFKEAITNVAKHSNATRVDVHLLKEGKRLQMTIKDNGTSGNGMATNTPSSSQGLENMEMRAKKMNAQLSIVNDEGFEVTVNAKV